MKNRPAKDRFGSNPWLRDWVNRPGVPLELAQLPEHWRITELHFLCDRPAGMQPGPWMVRSFRGAVGRVLKHWHAAGRSSLYPATAFEVFYQTHGMIGGFHIPKPIGFHIDLKGGKLRLRVALFGDACLWRDDFVEAASLALAGGIGLWENGRILRPWQMEDWHWIQRARRKVPEWTGRAMIVQPNALGITPC